MKFMNRYLASRAAAKRNLELYHAAVVIQRRMRGKLSDELTCFAIQLTNELDEHIMSTDELLL